MQIIIVVTNILEFRASVMFTCGTSCTIVFSHNLKYNTIVQFFFNYCIVLCCTHTSLAVLCFPLCLFEWTDVVFNQRESDGNASSLGMESGLHFIFYCEHGIVFESYGNWSAWDWKASWCKLDADRFLLCVFRRVHLTILCFAGLDCIGFGNENRYKTQKAEKTP